MYRYLFVLISILTLSVSTGAEAKVKRTFDQGLYLGFKGGADVVHDYVVNTRVSGVGPLKVENTAAYALSGALGYDFGSVRFEIETSGHASSVNTFSRLADGKMQKGSEGELSSFAVLANLYYDFKQRGKYTPYIGAGVGAAYVEFDDYGTDANPNILSDNGSGLAYQGIAGFEYELHERIGITAEYRYFATSDIEMTTTLGSNPVDVPYRNHSLLAGLRMKF